VVLMRRFAVLVLALALVPLFAANASAATKPGCPTNKPKVVDANDSAENIADLGADGHVWALDAWPSERSRSGRSGRTRTA
jgi:hypothetical protein